MKLNIQVVLFLVLFNFISIGQEVENTNYISGGIKVPLKVDQIINEVNFSDHRRDYYTKTENISNDLFDQLKRIPIYFMPKGAFNGYYTEKLGEFITEITVSGYMNTKTNLGTITVQQKEIKNVKANPMNVCDYDYEYSYNYEYKNLIVTKGIQQKNGSADYFFRPDKNTTLTVRDFKYNEFTKCPKRNSTKEILYKNINEDYLKEHLSGYGSYFSFTLNWDGKYSENNTIIKDSIQIISIVEDHIFKLMNCSCPPFDGSEGIKITYTELTNIILNENYQISKVFPNLKSSKEILEHFNKLKDKLGAIYGVRIESDSSIENGQYNKAIIKETITAPLEMEGKEFCGFLKKIINMK